MTQYLYKILKISKSNTQKRGNTAGKIKTERKGQTSWDKERCRESQGGAKI